MGWIEEGRGYVVVVQSGWEILSENLKAVFDLMEIEQVIEGR